MSGVGPGGVVVLVSQWLLISIAAAIIVARLWLRVMIQRRRMWASDILMVLAWLASVATASTDIVFFRLGALEPHVDSFLRQYKGGVDNVILILQIFWISSIPFYLTFYLCKAALLATFLQLFPRFMTRRRIALWCVVGYTVASFVISIVYHTTGCLPVQRNWSIGEDACPAEFTGASFRLAWALHFSSDVFVFALPWLILHEVQMKRAMKVGIYCTFLLGLLNLSICIVRFATIESADGDKSVPLSLIDLWSSLDCNITLVIACLPSLRPYFRSRKTIMGPSDRYTSGKYGSTSVRKSTVRPSGGLSKRGFESLDEERGEGALSPAPPGSMGGVMRTTTIHVHREPSVSSDMASGGSWLRDERGKSDIELVAVKKPTREEV
ncbi:hypothetical protein RB595_006119 [Gaeumannomyces hyphopodioides]